jgi:HEAT repeat protein
VLDILDEISPGRRLLPVLSHLVSGDDRKLSSRAALFIGRRVQSAEWAAKQLLHGDERVRASAIQSIWGLRSPTAVSLMEGAIDDPNNRVAGNAVLGLHIAEAQGVAEIVLNMARKAGPHFRSTAAWIMGRIANPEFAPELNRLLKDESSMVRSTALRALIEFRCYETKLQASMAERAAQLSEEEAAEQAKATEAEILEPEKVPEFVPVPIEVRLDGKHVSFAPT